MARQAKGDAEHARLVERLAVGAAVSDERFDRLFPPELRQLSARHWTPVNVARAAARLLAGAEGGAILDVGSGVGKLCILGALTSTATFLGIEEREELVTVARSAAQRIDARRARFLAGSAFDLDWSRFRGLYLYNPFGELLEQDADAYRQQVGEATERLRRMPVGARVVLYHGLGADLPSGYRRTFSSGSGAEPLEAWVRVDAPAS
jgi:predicted RNA methylase